MQISTIKKMKIRKESMKIYSTVQKEERMFARQIAKPSEKLAY